MMRLPRFRLQRRDQSQSVADYQRLVRRKLRRMPGERSLALAQAIGSPTMDEFARMGDTQVAVLRHHGLSDGMAVYDLGCGCGRTAQALRRSGWNGSYIGADVVPELLDELRRQCPGFETRLNYTPAIAAPDATLDIVFHWSVFTHLHPGEAYLYTADAFRALKPGGKMVFSFLEMEEPAHSVVWDAGVTRLRDGDRGIQLDAFLHRDWIRRFARDAGFAVPTFTDGLDCNDHPALWQALAVMQKPPA